MKIKRGTLLAYQERWPYFALVLEIERFEELHQKRCKKCRAYGCCWPTYRRNVESDEILLRIFRFNEKDEKQFVCAVESVVKEEIGKGKIILF